ncbi:hypothetical protein DMP23_42765 [Amycolatopsis sp. A1MSW2902]
MDPAAGVMVRAVWFGPEGAPGRLLLVIHHAVIDGVSWRILFDDLAAARGRSRTARGARFVACLAASLAPRIEKLRAGSAVLARSAGKHHSGDRNRRRRPRGPCDASRATSPTRFFPGPEVVPGRDPRRLAQHPRHCRDARAGHDSVLIETEGHGRDEDLDLSRTVGWLTSSAPLRINRRTPIPCASSSRPRTPGCGFPPGTRCCGTSPET